MIGIYCIRNLVDGKRYIGQSVNVDARLGYHKSLLKHGKHNNLHLQRAFVKYGVDRFRFEVLCECQECELDNLEKYWISHYNAMDTNYGYNLNTGGSLFRRFADEVIKRLTEKRRARSRKPDGSLNINEARQLQKRLRERRVKPVIRELYGYTPKQIGARLGIRPVDIVEMAGRGAFEEQKGK